MSNHAIAVMHPAPMTREAIRARILELAPYARHERIVIKIATTRIPQTGGELEAVGSNEIVVSLDSDSPSATIPISDITHFESEFVRNGG